mmetsp:Transcript_4571/g.13216  ORF Transcript_4571/g.13216 Transcript_4571/m.13216 type:complete len:98 (+) Transcript_4571:1235-1528(+)
MSNTARSLLVPVDESKASRYVFKWVLDNILRDGDKVHLLHVVKPGRYVLLSSVWIAERFVHVRMRLCTCFDSTEDFACRVSWLMNSLKTRPFRTKTW